MRGLGLPGCASAVTVPTSTKPKPSASSDDDAGGVLVEAGGEPERAGQLASECVDAQRRVARREHASHHGAHAGHRGQRAQERERHAMRALDRKPREHEPVDEAVHRAARSYRTHSQL